MGEDRSSGEPRSMDATLRFVSHLERVAREQRVGWAVDGWSEFGNALTPSVLAEFNGREKEI